MYRLSELIIERTNAERNAQSVVTLYFASAFCDFEGPGILSYLLPRVKSPVPRELRAVDDDYKSIACETAI